MYRLGAASADLDSSGQHMGTARTADASVLVLVLGVIFVIGIWAFFKF